MESSSAQISTLSIDDLDPEDERSQEIATVSYIFPELILLGPHSFSLSIAVSPVAPIPIVFSDDTTSTAARTITHFPPLQLTVTLPESYPLESPPNVKLESIWLTKEILARLYAELVGIWGEMRDQMLYAVIDHLIQKAEEAFVPYRGTQSLVISRDLEDEMISFNKKALKEEFNKGTYECGVCLEPKKGKACHRLFPCNHVFCINCLSDYYTTSITEGDVSNVKCLDPSCILNKKPKHTAAPDPAPQPDAEAPEAEDPPPPPKATLPPTLPPAELEDLGLDTELVTRYRVLKRKAALDADPTTIYCPRSWCQAPSRSSLEEMDKNIGTKDFYLTERHLELKKAELSGRKLDDAAEETPAAPQQPVHELERLDVCSSCAYSFCKVCRKGWHGDYVSCRRKDAPKTEEELATEAYLYSVAARCPSCGAHVIKSHGCNHMLCRCKTHFCFLCGAYLMASDPYKHFNSKENERCFMKLWEGEDGDGMAGRGVRPPDPEHPEEEEEEDDDVYEPIFDVIPEQLLGNDLEEDEDFGRRFGLRE